MERFEIKHRYTSVTLFAAECESMRECIARAIKAKADLRFADLQSADLRYANLQFADLQFAKNVGMLIATSRILPDGDLIGWKKCRNGVIVKLKIPAKAKRSHAFGRKCRAEYVRVLEIVGKKKAVSQLNGGTEYVVGKTVRCDKWCDDWQQECAGGIHFFITREEAEAH